MSEPILRLEGLCKDFGEGLVLNDLSLDIYPGEFLTLLGPSGCGKTTTLRIIAGLERPTCGRVFLEGTDVTGLPPEKRHVNTVFQNYALFPHMNVFQNIAYGLKVLKISKQEQRERVMNALALVRLSGYERRMPSQLSGGQRQRVAIARAVVLQPKVLLLDEPLGALDLKLRQDMQKELKQLQGQLGITFVYITHDQEEALNMSSRIVIMRAGRIEQTGTPEEVYEHPRTLFAADFIGQSNLLHGVVTGVSADGLTLEVEGVSLPALPSDTFHPAVGEKAVLCLRPQRVRYGSRAQHGMALRGVIRSKEYAGGMQHTQIALSDRLSLNAVTQSAELDSYALGSEVCVGWSMRHAPLVPDAPGEAV
ncbi:MAG: ABC transporter ATP-binding protein [Clostridiales bacterium]|nr:ABC transporter ATP-binding protein [Clostridiales bacterium]MDO4349117.1 ABC transporter ATP-binding protein [Eubacteriales bacterium]MDY4008995.1 ABC transporter ATP-binding protein [Candidatus Limiplasma sp.]